ncbi:MAG TPA: AfsA-related hotdog domain-containing protein [Solirubrobacterales bacterium]
MVATSEQRSAAELRTDRPLDRQLVHKSAFEQVFVTDWTHDASENWCTVAGRLPLAHARFSDSAAPYHDILLIAETVRQAGLVVAAKILNIESDRQFLLREMKVELDPIEHARRDRDNCDVLIAHDSTSKVKMRPGRTMVGGFLRAQVTIGGRPAGVCEVTGAWVPDDFYESFRSGNASGETSPPTPPARGDLETRTGKLNPANSVITPIRPTTEARGYEASLAIDVEDPTFFDHPLDHLPGLCLLEGMQQVALAAACEELAADHTTVLVSAMQMKFSRIAELQPDVTCTVTLDEGCSTGRVGCMQGNRSCCEGTIRIARLGR